MPLTIKKNFPLNNICFWSTQNHSEISFASHIDSCAATNVENIKIHQWFITTHPYIVFRYIQYNNENTFEPKQLNCAVEDYENVKDTYGKLIPLVVYNPNYFHPNSTKIVRTCASMHQSL